MYCTEFLDEADNCDRDDQLPQFLLISDNTQDSQYFNIEAYNSLHAQEHMEHIAVEPFLRIQQRRIKSIIFFFLIS